MKGLAWNCWSVDHARMVGSWENTAAVRPLRGYHQPWDSDHHHPRSPGNTNLVRHLYGPSEPGHTKASGIINPRMDERAGWIDQQCRGVAGPLDTHSFLMDQSCSARTARYLPAAHCTVYTGARLIMQPVSQWTATTFAVVTSSSSSVLTHRETLSWAGV